MLKDKQPDRHGDPALRGRGDAGRGDREVGGGGRHLPLSAQLQRSPGDHFLPEPQLCLQAQEDLAQGLQAGTVYGGFHSNGCKLQTVG